MCGDGGNDASAMKLAHAGIALSDKDSQVVAHFSSKNRTIMSCVELLKEARCCLDTSFAAYKYLLIYGHTTALVGLIQNYFLVNMSQSSWVFIDGSTIPIIWALTQALPSYRLTQTRPTARLLGAETIISTLGPILINLFFSIFTIMILQNQSFYPCNQFNGNGLELRRWWERADNYEGRYFILKLIIISITSIITMYQIIHAAFAYNIGEKYRQGGKSNQAFLAIYGMLFSLISSVLLFDPNFLGCIFRINCGTAEALKNNNYPVPYNAPADFFSDSGHNVIPFNFRIAIFVISLVNLSALVLFEKIAVLGHGRVWAIQKFREMGDDQTDSKRNPFC